MSSIDLGAAPLDRRLDELLDADPAALHVDLTILAMLLIGLVRLQEQHPRITLRVVAGTQAEAQDDDLLAA